MDSKSIIRMRNAGFEILDAIFTNDSSGYCIGVSPSEYVVWWFKVLEDDVSFYHGQYFMVDEKAPKRSRARAMANFYLRVSEGFDNAARWNRWEG